jgi:UDP-N-acetylmuramyl pentapeptide phosphotransferase/UDP-N-acetylglucosamine-1-phosphate transferase
MDGINGITGAYSLVVLGGLQYVNLRQIHFINEDMIWLPMLACIVFLYFNFRKSAKCFAGDVGSITIAFWIMFLLLNLIFASNNWVYILFLAVYGVDAALTIIHHLLLRQNIFKPHRLHFYQVLANEQQIPHLLVSCLYAFIQLVIIILIVKSPYPIWVNFSLVCFPLLVIYLIFKPTLMKNKAIK